MSMHGRAASSEESDEVVIERNANLPSRNTKVRLVEAQHLLNQRQSAQDGVSSTLDKAKEQLAFAKETKVQTQHGLVSAYSSSASMRSLSAELTFDLKISLAAKKVAESELAACVSSAAAEQAIVLSLKERLRVVANMKGALGAANLDTAKHHVKLLVLAAGAFAKVAVFAAQPQDVAEDLAEARAESGAAAPQSAPGGGGALSPPPRPFSRGPGSASPDARRPDENSVEALQPNLAALVAEIATLEIDAHICRSERDRSRSAAADCERQNDVLEAGNGHQRASLERGQAELAALRAKLSAARQELKSCQLGVRGLREEFAQMEYSIGSHQASMHAVSRAFHGQVKTMGPALAEAKRKRAHAELLHARRLEEVIALARQSRALALNQTQRRSLPHTARGPTTPTGVTATGAPEQAASPTASGDRVLPSMQPLPPPPSPAPRPATANTVPSCWEPLLLTEPTFSQHAQSGGHAAPAPPLDFRTPELRPGTSGPGRPSGNLNSVRLGQAGHMVLGKV
eukprot:CAMPEP_0203869630 /NCGR_PEP_ID=MMETSP0359-20131031/17816_1 /ASSEMBLY_ACC=CAM_ASM_000338 /TAXON_ID=268821 /ORGANISM="Scrippsiella Hangoei, Strain SHTV-5" /LENGTH=514 /DNA_ID=CAMNT_0050788269 /DNA_START=110 /DNA_END=1654 /DNA_ORIENTATION=+